MQLRPRLRLRALLAAITAVAVVAGLPAAPASAQATKPRSGLPELLASSVRPRPKLETPVGDFSRQPPLKAAKADYARSFDPARSTVAARSERATIWANPSDGTYTAEIHNGQVNWNDGGTWRAIDTTLEASGSTWRARSAPVRVAVPDTTGAAPLAALTGDGWSLSFSLEGASAGVKARVDGENVTYAGLATDLDVVERVGRSGSRSWPR